jgi:hypothetical protein
MSEELPGNLCAVRACRRRVRWARTHKGKLIALDPDPDERGTVELSAAIGGVPMATFHVTDPPGPGDTRYMVHKATCAGRSRRPAASGWPKHGSHR